MLPSRAAHRAALFAVAALVCALLAPRATHAQVPEDVREAASALVDHLDPQRYRSSIAALEALDSRHWSQEGNLRAVEWLDADTDFEDEHDEIFITATATVYGIRDLLKLQVEFTHRDELHGATVDNDSMLFGAQLSF